MRTTFSCIRRSGHAVLVAFVLAAGCSENDATRKTDPPVPVVTRPKSDAPTRPAPGEKVLNTGPFEKKLDGIRFSVPARWMEVALAPQQQGFIDARFRIPTAHGDVSLTCSSNAGGIESNVQRWIGQFQMQPGEKPTVEEIDVGGKQATWVDLHGAFAGGPMSGMAGSAGPIERMLGVAIPMNGRDFYLKLTGANAAVSDIRDAFREFVRDARVGT